MSLKLRDYGIRQFFQIIQLRSKWAKICGVMFYLYLCTLLSHLFSFCSHHFPHLSYLFCWTSINLFCSKKSITGDAIIYLTLSSNNTLSRRNSFVTISRFTTCLFILEIYHKKGLVSLRLNVCINRCRKLTFKEHLGVTWVHPLLAWEKLKSNWKCVYLVLAQQTC
jgi:hypothetical protein